MPHQYIIFSLCPISVFHDCSLFVPILLLTLRLEFCGNCLNFPLQVDLLKGQKSDRVDVTLAPEELELMDNVLPAK